MLVRVVAGYRTPDLTSGFIFSHLEHYLKLPHWRWSFYSHAVAGPLILFSGLIAVLSREKLTQLHRWVGKIYVAVVLFFAAPTGFLMAFFAMGGVVAKASFLTLSILWFWITYRGYQFGKQKKVMEHATLMTLSLGLTCSALVQRRIVFFGSWIDIFFEVDSSPYLYTVSSVLGWTLTLTAALIIVKKTMGQDPKKIFALIK